MIYNTMASEFVKNAIGRYPETLQNVFHAVNELAYQACHTIEGPLGEGRGGRIIPFDYNRLVEATSESIRTLARDKTSFTGMSLYKSLTDAALTDIELDAIIAITQEEALKRINKATSEDKLTFTEHGHHGRQYIARNTVERVMKEVLSLQI